VRERGNPGLLVLLGYGFGWMITEVGYGPTPDRPLGPGFWGGVALCALLVVLRVHRAAIEREDRP